MIKFFRKIRQQLLTENKFSKYLIYAIGEIVLVVIGILIALYINSWKENKEKEGQFNLTLDQIYTNLKFDLDMQTWHLSVLDNQLKVVDSLIDENSVFHKSKLPLVLSYLDWLPGPGFTTSNSDYYISQLKYNHGEREKSNLEFQISAYYSMLKDWINPEWENNKRMDITTLLKKYAIPKLQSYPYLYEENFDAKYLATDSTVIKIQSMLNTEGFNSALISTRMRFETFKYFINVRNAETESLIKSIKVYNPKTRLRIDNIVLIGSALGDDTKTLKPMIPVDGSKGVWEVICHLKKGSVRFTSESKPFLTWGGNNFPNGKILMFGNYILVPEGKYKIILNLEELHYQFIKQD